MRKRRGFTIIELIIVVAIISILAVLVFVNLRRSKEKAKLSRVSTELSNISNSINQYYQDNNYQYPDDATRDVPPGLEKYLAGGTWPESIWPHGVFDWDNIHGPGGDQIYQIIYRLCDTDDPIAYCSDPILFPNFTRYSGILYCVQGPCIPHEDHPTDPAYCVNCKPKEINY